MKYTFEKEDIKAGMYLKRKNISNISILSWNANRLNKAMNVTEINTDGMTLLAGNTHRKLQNI